MTVPDTVHQRRGGPDGTLRFLGKVNGSPYDVLVSVEGGTCAWFDGDHVDAVIAPAYEPTDTTSESDCPGCHHSLIKLAKGGWGLLKASLGVDAADDEVVANRTNICLFCPDSKYRFGVCDECSCFLDAKVRIQSESCPGGHW